MEDIVKDGRVVKQRQGKTDVSLFEETISHSILGSRTIRALHERNAAVFYDCVRTVFARILETDCDELIDARIAYEVARVMEAGLAQGYERSSWRELPAEQYMHAAIRHLGKITTGYEEDKQSGLLHISHALCDAAFAMWIADSGTEVSTKEFRNG